MQARTLLLRLNELGNRPVQPLVTQSYDQYYWQVPIDGQMYHFEADLDGPDAWYIVFADSERRYGMTGVGHKTAVKVISTLLHFIQALRRAKHPQVLTFSASGDSRLDLYERLLRYLVRQNPGSEWDSRSHGYSRDYRVVFPTSEAYQVNELGADWSGRGRRTRESYGERWVVDIEGSPYLFYAFVRRKDDTGRTTVDIQFEDAQGEMGLTGVGHATAIQVFSAVDAFVRHAIQTYHPREMTFTAEEASRQKLYGRLVQRLARRFPGTRVVRGSFGIFRVILPQRAFRHGERVETACALLQRLDGPLHEVGDVRSWQGVGRIIDQPAEFPDTHGHRWVVPIDGERYTFIATVYGKSATMVKVYIDFIDAQGSMDITGIGHATAVKVFSAAGAFVEQVLNRYHPDLLGFSGAEPSRRKLYMRLANRILQRIPHSRLKPGAADGFYRIQIPTEFYEHARRHAPMLRTRLEEIGSTAWEPQAQVSRRQGMYKWKIPIDGETYTFTATQPGSSSLYQDIGFSDSAGSYGLTGVGHRTAVKVLSAVIHFVFKVIQEYEPSHLTFSARGQSRRDLYARMIKTLSRRIPGAQWHAEDEGPYTHYLIRIPDSYYDALPLPLATGQTHWYTTSAGSDAG